MNRWGSSSEKLYSHRILLVEGLFIVGVLFSVDGDLLVFAQDVLDLLFEILLEEQIAQIWVWKRTCLRNRTERVTCCPSSPLGFGPFGLYSFLRKSFQDRWEMSSSQVKSFAVTVLMLYFIWLSLLVGIRGSWWWDSRSACMKNVNATSMTDTVTTARRLNFLYWTSSAWKHLIGTCIG